MADLTVQSALITATLTPAFAACAAGGDSFVNNGRTLLYFKNANVGASRTITVNSLLNCDQGYDHNITITVPQSSEEITGFFSAGRFNAVATGKVSMTYSSEADLTVAAISID